MKFDSMDGRICEGKNWTENRKKNLLSLKNSKLSRIKNKCIFSPSLFKALFFFLFFGMNYMPTKINLVCYITVWKSQKKYNKIHSESQLIELFILTYEEKKIVYVYCNPVVKKKQRLSDINFGTFISWK